MGTTGCHLLASLGILLALAISDASLLRAFAFYYVAIIR